MKKNIMYFLGILLVATQIQSAQADKLSSSSEATAKHLIYLNGCCLKKVGTYSYKKIVKKLGKDGFNVTFEPRYDDSDAGIESAVESVTAQVKKLLASGTKPENIVIAGYSLGSVIAMLSSISINNPKVKFVLLAGCPVNTRRDFDISYSSLTGNFLSIVDKDDDRFGSCGDEISGAKGFKEITIQTGSGHKGFRHSDSSSLKSWKEPMENWVNQ